MILAYYKNNKEFYKAYYDSYKIQYVVLSADLPNLQDLVTELNEDKVGQFIQDYCLNNDSTCMLTPSWVNGDLLVKLKLPSYLWNESGKFQEYYIDNSVCLFRLIDIRKKGAYLSLEQASTEIREVLIFQKSLELYRNYEDDLFINAQNNEDFEIY